MTADGTPRLTIDHNQRGYRYYRNAVSRHWDPADVDLSADVANLSAADPAVLDGLRGSLAKFGAGEQAVTEDLSPLAHVLESVEDQLFITTQLYEEAKHTDFFDRYWRDVINEVETDLGLPTSSPTESHWFNEAYDDLFARNETAMTRLLSDDTPENRARAYCHYHLVVETPRGNLSQAMGWLQTTYTCRGSFPGSRSYARTKAATSDSAWRNSKNSSTPASTPTSSTRSRENSSFSSR